MGDQRVRPDLHGWTGLLFPNPETSCKSTLADANNNNVTASRTSASTQLLDVYDREFDQQKRVAIIREIDGILANIHHYVLSGTRRIDRIAYWNKFGQPEGYLTRIGDYRDVPSLWWIDPQKEQQVAQGWATRRVKLAVGTTEVTLLAASTRNDRAARSATAAGAE